MFNDRRARGANSVPCDPRARQLSSPRSDGRGVRPAMTPLVVENVVKRFRQGDRDVSALAGVSLEVAEGTFLAVMGASGSGKSTLLHLMAGLATTDAGRILVRGENLSEMNDRELTLFRRRHIG